ncbi:MAG: hypothetical protein C0423_19840 [Methylibium sp.]|nr:hypothetical protein [Methylibium sp.]
MPTTRAKFRCFQITDPEGGVRSIQLQAVSSESTHNAALFIGPPNAHINLVALNAAAAEQFAPGREFYVDFTPADAPAAG